LGKEIPLQGKTLHIQGQEVNLSIRTTGNGISVQLTPDAGTPQPFLDQLLVTAQQWCNDTLKAVGNTCTAQASIQGGQVTINAFGDGQCYPQLESRIEQLPGFFERMGQETGETRRAYAGTST
jgi:hypothetical protein